MKFNAKKCYILSVTNKGKHKFYELNSYILKHVENNPYLGLILSKDLKFSTHIDLISRKASSTLGFIQRNLKKCPSEVKRTAYISLVRSTLEYGATVWDPHLEKDIYKLERIQRKAVRFINSDYRSRDPGSVTQMLKDQKLPSLKERRKDKRLLLMYNLSKGLVPAIPSNEYLKPITSKRKIKAKTFSDYKSDNIVKRHQILHENCYQLPQTRTVVYKNSIFPKTISKWNELPKKLKQK